MVVDQPIFVQKLNLRCSGCAGAHTARTSTSAGRWTMDSRSEVTSPLRRYTSPTITSEQRHGKSFRLCESIAYSHERRASSSPLSLSVAREPQQNGRDSNDFLFDDSSPTVSAHETSTTSPHAIRGESVEDRLLRLGNDSISSLERQRENAQLERTVAEISEEQQVNQARCAKNSPMPRHAAAASVVNKQAALQASDGHDDGFAQEGVNGWGLELVAWREHSLYRVKSRGQHALNEAERIKKELKSPPSPAMSPGSIRICNRKNDGMYGSQGVGNRLHTAARVQQARRELAAATSAAGLETSSSPECHRSPRPSPSTYPVGQLVVGNNLSNVHRQIATGDDEAASMTISPRVDRTASTPRRASPRTAEIAGLRLHQSAMDAATRRSAAQKGAETEARKMASPRLRRGEQARANNAKNAGIRLHRRAMDAATRRSATQKEADAQARNTANPKLHKPRRRDSISDLPTEASDPTSIPACQSESQNHLTPPMKSEPCRTTLTDEDTDKRLRRLRFWAAIAEAEREIFASRIDTGAQQPEPGLEPETEPVPVLVSSTGDATWLSTPKFLTPSLLCDGHTNFAALTAKVNEYVPSATGTLTQPMLFAAEHLKPESQPEPEQEPEQEPESDPEPEPEPEPEPALSPELKHHEVEATSTLHDSGNDSDCSSDTGSFISCQGSLTSC